MVKEEELSKIIKEEIRDKIWREVLLTASMIDNKKIVFESLKILKLFRKVQANPSDEELLSRFLWTIENEITLEFKAAISSKKLLHILRFIKNEYRLMGFYLASWSRIYGRHALIQGIKESIERIELDMNELEKFSKDILLLTYLYSEDKKFAKTEVLRLCTLTENSKDCKKMIEYLESVPNHLIPRDKSPLKNTKEMILGSFFSIENTVLYIIHERLVDPLLSDIERLLPEGLTTPSKVLDYLSTRADRTYKMKIWNFVNIYLDVIP